MPGLFDRFRRRLSKSDAEVQARELFERGVVLQQDSSHASAVRKIPGLLESIKCYQGVLSLITERDFPEPWALTQYNLGIAYRNLPTGNLGEDLPQAIACCQAALQVYTEQDFPEQWAGWQPEQRV